MLKIIHKFSQSTANGENNGTFNETFKNGPRKISWNFQLTWLMLSVLQHKQFLIIKLKTYSFYSH